ncbi:head-tail connector protein [Sphingomonas sp. A2-49]|uniref:head-tail connector protein n=1 Tax=Sphingomonas sp. A2-49 TaxID=1391375 RepID=UPI0021D1B4CA|nr:head-tail connector protein [Sphingomonas sp. A2-49]MCU6454347.1 head-tail connector protein [Sphingomonas sp. A2-49]
MTDEPVTLAEVKTHLRLELTETADDDHLGILILAARRAIEKRTGRIVVGDAAAVGGDDVRLVSVSILMLVAAWYSNREAVVTSNAAPNEMPLAVEWLIAPLRRLIC